jgi:hypothetical protein
MTDGELPPPTAPFFLIVTDHDRGVFCVEGPKCSNPLILDPGGQTLSVGHSCTKAFQRNSNQIASGNTGTAQIR